MENLSKEDLYEIFRTRDERYDGRFYVGVKTTGIYCRPVCPAMPKPENCVYFDSQAAAEKAGFRPCLVCRPELAPGYATIDSKRNIAYTARILLEEKMNTDTVIEDVCKIIGCTDRHLRRVFNEEFGVNPIEYIQTCRLLLAKKLLTDTNISMTDVAFSSGFGSIKRFNTLFKEKYKLTPTSFRKESKNKKSDEIVIKIGYKNPYDYDGILKFFALRTIEGIEKIENKVYIRTIQINKHNKTYCGVIKISNDKKKNCLNLTITEELLKVLPEVITKIKNQFDIYSEPNRIYESLKGINDISSGLFIKGTRMPGGIDDFEICVRAIIGQLVSVKSARATLRKIVENFGDKINYEGKEMYLFPTSDKFLNLDKEITNILGPLGITKTKAYAIKGIAEYLVNNNINFNDCLDPNEEINNLMKIKGIGKWTAEYISMRTMKNTNILLDTDYGIKKVFEKYPKLQNKELQETWNPWKTYITVGLWNYLEQMEEEK